MADEPGAIPTIEIARVSALADAIVQQFDGYAASDPIGAARHHAAIMALVEPELASMAAARSSIAALRATVAELQELARHLAQPIDVAEWLRDMPLQDRQALNVQLLVAIGRAPGMLAAIDELGGTLLPWLATRIEAGNLVPTNRREVIAA